MDSGEDQLWAARYRLGANEARERAKSAKSEDARRTLLKLAAEYDQSVADCERRIGLKNSKSD